MSRRDEVVPLFLADTMIAESKCLDDNLSECFRAISLIPLH
jgi:hypothetical protein